MKERKIETLLKEYAESHQNRRNKQIHWICVPLIFFSAYGMLRCVPVPDFFYELSVQFNWANIFLFLSLIYYLFLSFPLSLEMLVWSTLVVVGNSMLLHQVGFSRLLGISFLIFCIAWVGQFVGHRIEGKKPSFLKDLQFLLIGPAWLMNFILKVVPMP